MFTDPEKNHINNFIAEIKKLLQVTQKREKLLKTNGIYQMT